MSEKLAKIINGDEIKYFKQFNIYETLQFPYENINLHVPIEAITKLDINSTKIIDTFQGTSIEGQCLTGKKLIVLGNLNIKLLIPYCDCKPKIHIQYMNLPFSTFIIIPKKICEDQPIKLKYLIEDSTAKAINTHSILVSETILLQFVDEYI